MTAFVRMPSVAGLSYVARVRRHLHPPLPWLAILGPDGSGKSTLLAGIRDAWPAALGRVHVYHLRPERLSRPGRAVGPVVDPHAQPPRGAVLSAAALMFVLTDWWLGYWTSIVRQRAQGDLVVFDRHLLDVLVDPRRYRYGGPLWLARAACAVVPRPNVIVILDASPDVVRARKQEVTEAESHRQHGAYRHLAEVTPGAHLVDAARPPADVLEAVMAILRHEVDHWTVPLGRTPADIRVKTRPRDAHRSGHPAVDGRDPQPGPAGHAAVPADSSRIHDQQPAGTGSEHGEL